MTRPKCPCCPTPTDPRQAIAAAFLDYALQADLRGDYFEATIWRRAADVADGFVEKPGTEPR